MSVINIFARGTPRSRGRSQAVDSYGRHPGMRYGLVSQCATQTSGGKPLRQGRRENFARRGIVPRAPPPTTITQRRCSLEISSGLRVTSGDVWSQTTQSD